MKGIQNKIWGERQNLKSSKIIYELKKKRLKQAEKIKQSIEEELRKLSEELEKCEDKKDISPFPLQPNTIPIPPPLPPMSATYKDKKDVVVNLNDALATNPKLKKVAPEEELKDSVKDFVSELKVKLKSGDGQTIEIEEKRKKYKEEALKEKEKESKQGNFFTGIFKPQHVKKSESQLKEELEELKRQNESMKSSCSELDEEVRKIENESHCLKDLYQNQSIELEKKKAKRRQDETEKDIKKTSDKMEMFKEILEKVSEDKPLNAQQKEALGKLLQNRLKELNKLSKSQQQEQQENGILSVTSGIKLSDPSVKKYVKKSEEKVRQQG